VLFRSFDVLMAKKAKKNTVNTVNGVATVAFLENQKSK
jgi:hypothetical protein